MRKLLVFVILIFLPLSVLLAQTKFTVSGYVRDNASGEELIGVSVYLEGTGTGTVTNVYGFYSLTLPSGDYDLIFRYLGYVEQTIKLELYENTDLNIALEEQVTQMDEVVITGRAPDANITDVGMSKNELNIEQVKRLPALFGEPDIIKAIQMLPGVVSAGEGTSSFFVRGGSADQNLILIDEAPVYDPSHLFGLFSVFNSDVIKSSELYKGGIPSRYGGKLSSILDVRTRDGNFKEFKGSAGIGLLASKAMLEGPLKKEKGSFIISARRSYVDALLKAAGEKNFVRFYDLNAKINWRHNQKNRFFAAFYLGRDNFDFSDTFNFGWGNRTATLRWNHLFNDRLFSNTSLIASQFDYKLGLQDAVQGFQWYADITEYTLKEDLSYYISPALEIEFGYMGTYREFEPGTITPLGEDSFINGLKQDHLYALDHNVYIDIKNKISERLDLQYGLRLSLFQHVGSATIYTYSDPADHVLSVRTSERHYDKMETIKAYINPEPRFSMRYMLNSRSSLKTSYNRMVQNTHLISSGTVPLPFNTWQPSSAYLRPQKADLVALGYFRNFMKNTLEFSLEGYYKTMMDVTDFADNAQLFFNKDLPIEFRQGRSWSYGGETMVQKQKGRFTGFLSYTWSKTQREVPDVNLGRAFPANYDRPHSFNAVATYELSDKWTFGANFNYGSGRPVTIPSGKYEIEGFYVPDLITERNGYRLPAYHRADISANLYPRHKKQWKLKSSWSFSVYNVYSRKNPFTIYTQVPEDENGNPLPNRTQKEARMIYIFPILPSVTWNVDF
ncbi:MAG: TonB-dependent receptor [Cyclobacteriaceae bacterium]|nr:TonB-dependent receptor [Cyclobacteriaceae bacterium]